MFVTEITPEHNMIAADVNTYSNISVKALVLIVQIFINVTNAHSPHESKYEEPSSCNYLFVLTR